MKSTKTGFAVFALVFAASVAAFAQQAAPPYYYIVRPVDHIADSNAVITENGLVLRQQAVEGHVHNAHHGVTSYPAASHGSGACGSCGCGSTCGSGCGSGCGSACGGCGCGTTLCIPNVLPGVLHNLHYASGQIINRLTCRCPSKICLHLSGSSYGSCHTGCGTGCCHSYGTCGCAGNCYGGSCGCDGGTCGVPHAVGSGTPGGPVNVVPPESVPLDVAPAPSSTVPVPPNEARVPHRLHHLQSRAPVRIHNRRR